MAGWARAQNLEEQFKKMEKERGAAVVKGDAEALAKETAEDFTFITSTGQMSDKKQTVEPACPMSRCLCETWVSARRGSCPTHMVQVDIPSSRS
jgi:hypothetical protein